MPRGAIVPITLKKLRELWNRRLAGEPTVLLALEVGISRRSLRLRWRRNLKVDPNKAYKRRGGIRDAANRNNDRGLLLHGFIDSGKNWIEVCALLSIEHNDPTINRLRMCLVRYCRREKLRVPKVRSYPRGRRPKSST